MKNQACFLRKIKVKNENVVCCNFCLELSSTVCPLFVEFSITCSWDKTFLESSTPTCYTMDQVEAILFYGVIS